MPSLSSLSSLGAEGKTRTSFKHTAETAQKGNNKGTNKKEGL